MIGKAKLAETNSVESDYTVFDLVSPEHRMPWSEANSLPISSHPEDLAFLSRRWPRPQLRPIQPQPWSMLSGSACQWDRLIFSLNSCSI